MHPLYTQHAKTLEGALNAIRTRDYWSAYPEAPSGKIYGESAKDDGLAAFRAMLNRSFDIDQPGRVGEVGDEVSPFGLPLNIKYPKADLNVLLKAAQAAIPAWRDAGPEARVGVLLEILSRLNKRSFEIANTVMHTTGQAFMMAFQAGGPHAQDRALEAVAYAFDEMRRTPAAVDWKKQVSKSDVVSLRKRYHLVPRGVAAVIGCSTFPTWNGYPGLFASLATGNAVVVKPHPLAILSLALTVRIAREALRENGFDANLVTLAADSLATPITKELVTRPEVRIVDYTGSSEFGAWVEANARQAVVFTEKAGVNCTVIDSAADIAAVANNLAFSLSLYAGQMCTSPQNIFVPASGIRSGGKTLSLDEVNQALVGAVDGLLGDARRAAEILGCIQNERTLERIRHAANEGAKVLRASAQVASEAFPNARIHSPLLLQTDSSQTRFFMREMFGPIAYVIATRDTRESLALAARCAQECGSITCGVYSEDTAIQSEAERLMAEVGAPLSINLTGPIYVNQAAAFSDFHVTGVNPSGNATLCDGAFVANRFRVTQCRTQV